MNSCIHLVACVQMVTLEMVKFVRNTIHALMMKIEEVAMLMHGVFTMGREIILAHAKTFTEVGRCMSV